MSEDMEKAKNVIERIKVLLFNYDLELAYARGCVRKNEITMRLYENDHRKDRQRKFLSAKVDKERFENYIDEIIDAKREIMDNIDIVLSNYTPVYKRVFIMYFFENKTLEEISSETNYSFDGVRWIINKLKSLIIQLYYI